MWRRAPRCKGKRPGVEESIGGELSKREGCFSTGGRSVQSEMIDYSCFIQI